MTKKHYIEIVECVLMALNDGCQDIPYLAKSLKTTQKMIKQIIHDEYFMLDIETDYERSVNEIWKNGQKSKDMNTIGLLIEEEFTQLMEEVDL